MWVLWLARNEFSGEIPDSFYNSSILTRFDLSQNKLHGRIPPSLGNCQNLFEFDLSDNNLSGTIPKEVISISSIKLILDLSKNSFSGSLPSEVSNLTDLTYLDLSKNRLSGHIPDALGRCLTLEYLNMEGNVFEGKIPKSLNALNGLKDLDLSHNKLSGRIPEYLQNFTLLTHLNLSFNEFEGSVPKDGIFKNASLVSVVGNNNLCGGVTGLKLRPCHIQTFKNRKFLRLEVFIPVIVVSVCLVLSSCILFMRYRKRMFKVEASLASFSSLRYMRVSYAELQRATNSFSSDNLIGVGSYGSVYKGIISQDNKEVAVKVFNLQQRGASKSFLSECNALKNLRHRNLLKIITSCSTVDFQGNDFKALVFEYLPNGSLEEWLHPKINGEHGLRNLNFLQRLNAAIDVASALDYLHHHCEPTIVHCDLKPSNVLIDNDMVAHVGDFGLARIFSTGSSKFAEGHASSVAIKGSIGYLPPEYGMGGEVSVQGDIYSYGILILEMFTGKRPTDDMFRDGLNFHNFSKMALSEPV